MQKKTAHPCACFPFDIISTPYESCLRSHFTTCLHCLLSFGFLFVHVEKPKLKFSWWLNFNDTSMLTKCYHVRCQMLVVVFFLVFIRNEVDFHISTALENIAFLCADERWNGQTYNEQNNKKCRESCSLGLRLKLGPCIHITFKVTFVSAADGWDYYYYCVVQILTTVNYRMESVSKIANFWSHFKYISNMTIESMVGNDRFDCEKFLLS